MVKLIKTKEQIIKISALLHSTYYYVFFAIFSFVIIPVSIIFLYSGKFGNVKLEGVNFFGTGFGFALMLISDILYSAIICIIFLLIFIRGILKKKFHPSLFFVPCIIIFLLVNFSILSICRNWHIFSSDFNPIPFFIAMNCLFLPFTYIPFIVLFGIISIIIYVKYKNSQINRKDLKRQFPEHQ